MATAALVDEIAAITVVHVRDIARFLAHLAGTFAAIVMGYEIFWTTAGATDACTNSIKSQLAYS